MSSEDQFYMERCLELARKGEFGARPNPMVGCVVVKDGEVVGEGWHQAYGDAHAEINALDMAGEKAQGATLYVSLEPCSHQGKTGPCCVRIAEAGVCKVVYGMIDPNALVAGKGIAGLEGSGIETAGPVLAEKAAALNPGFVKRMTHKLPFVRVKLAMSMDGRTAMVNGESKWITGEQARADVQLWRAGSGAVVTGVGTVLADNPRLNVRIPGAELKQPLRIIVDSALRTPVSAKIFQNEGEIVIATGVTDDKLISAKLDAVSSSQLQIVSLPDALGKVDLHALMLFLAQEKQCNDVLLESGPGLAGACLRAGLIDEMLLYIAPVLMGSEAMPLLHLPGLESMADRIELEIIEVALLGKDCRMRSRVCKRD